MSERKTTDLIIIHCAATTATMDVDAGLRKYTYSEGFVPLAIISSSNAMEPLRLVEALMR